MRQATLEFLVPLVLSAPSAILAPSVCRAQQGLQESLAPPAKPEKQEREVPRDLQDSVGKQEGAGCPGLRVKLGLKVKEALPANLGLLGKMARTVFRAPPVKMACQERTAKTGCRAKTEQMAKMAWMESMDNPGDQAKSARTEIPVLLEFLALVDLEATLGIRAREVAGASLELRACKVPLGPQALQARLAPPQLLQRHKNTSMSQWREHP